MAKHDRQESADLAKRNAKTPDEQIDPGADAQTVAASQLRSFLERVERLAEEKQAIADDIKEVFAEMKGCGFDTTAVRVLLRLRKMDEAERQERERIVDLYKAAIGME